MRVPDWIDKEAQKYWRKHQAYISNSNAETFAVLCQTYSDYRKTVGVDDLWTMRRQKALLDTYIKLARSFGILDKKEAVIEVEDIFGD